MRVEGINLSLDRKSLDFLLNDVKGEVGRHMRKLGLRIQVDARKMVGVRTGKLKRSIYMKHTRLSRYQHVKVGSNVRHAYMHHEGTKPHQIRAGQGRIMRFRVGGKVVYARKVNHPGTEPRKYLTIPMRRAVRRQ